MIASVMSFEQDWLSILSVPSSRKCESSPPPNPWGARETLVTTSNCMKAWKQGLASFSTAAAFLYPTSGRQSFKI